MACDYVSVSPVQVRIEPKQNANAKKYKIKKKLNENG